MGDFFLLHADVLYAAKKSAYHRLPQIKNYLGTKMPHNNTTL